MASSTHSENGNGHNGHYHGPYVLESTPQEVTRDLVGRVFTTSPGFWLAVLALLAIVALGVVGFVIRAADGTDDRAPWGYYVATFSFIFLIGGTAPLAAIAFRVTKNHWRRPMSRVSELYALVGLLLIVMFIPLILLYPSLEDEPRRSIWFLGTIHEAAPVWIDFFALVFLVICGIAVLYVSAWPDMKAVQDHRPGGLRGLKYGFMARRWLGSEKQWDRHKALLAMLGAWYFMLLLFVHFLISSDFSMSLIPGWIDSIMPAHHALTSIQAGLAVVILTCFLLRTVGGYQRYISIDVFWSSAKLLLAFSLLWGYFWFAEFNTFWYGRKPEEEAIIRFIMVDTYSLPFYLNLFGSFLVPFALLVWNPIRKSVIGPTIASCAILVGAFFMMVRFYVPAFGIKDLGAENLAELSQAHPEQMVAIWPGGPDYLIVFGGIAAVALIFLLGTRLLPVISLWETKEGMLYTVVRPFIRGRYTVMGKPE